MSINEEDMVTAIKEKEVQKGHRYANSSNAM